MESSSRANLLVPAAVPSFICPKGTKMHLLDLGTLLCDEGWLLRGANTSSNSNPNPENKRRSLICLAGLIEYPGFGCILFETGCAEDLQVAWGEPATDVFPRTVYDECHKLPAAIKATGNDIKDVKAVVLSHLHMDHAGGLEHFIGTDVPIYVHEEEFKHACWAVATAADAGVYLANYLSLDKLKWSTIHEEHVELFQGISLHHSPGHTPGLIVMQVNLELDGTFIWTGDQFHIAENYEQSHPHGWLARDHNAWIHSTSMIKRMQRLFSARLIFGHDKGVADDLIQAKKYYK